MNVELPPFKNGKHNSERVPTLDRDLTASIVFGLGLVLKQWNKKNSVQ